MKTPDTPGWRISTCPTCATKPVYRDVCWFHLQHEDKKALINRWRISESAVSRARRRHARGRTTHIAGMVGMGADKMRHQRAQ